MKTFCIILLFSGLAHSATLECKSLVNLQEQGTFVLETNLGTKNIVTAAEEFSSFLTQIKPDLFSLEIFVPNLEVRFYSESALKSSGESLSATVWSRDILIGVHCKKQGNP